MFSITNNNQFIRHDNRAIIKRFLISLFAFLTTLLFVFSIVEKKTIYCASQKQFYFSSAEENIENELKDNISNQLGDLDFKELELIIDKLDDSTKKYLNNKSFLEIVKSFINSENSSLFSNFFSYAISILFENITSLIPSFSIIIAIAIIYSLIGHVSSEKSKSISNLIHIVCFCSIAIVVFNIVFSLMDGVSSTIASIENQMEVIFPVVLTLITSIGSVVTATSFQPILAVLSVAITKLFTLVLIPIFIFTIIFSVVGNISSNMRMDKFAKFFGSLFNWIVGIVFTIFIAFLTIQGLTTSTLDAISLRTAKFAIKSYVPVLGSYLSDGVSLILASSVMIKNAVGATGLVVLGFSILVPIIKVGIVILLLKLVSAIIETLCDQKISNFLFNLSKSLNMLNISLIAVGFMYLISISMLMCCSNIF